MHWADALVVVAYIGGIAAAGIWFGKFTSSTSDFFFGGQRFAWWLVAMSCVATLVGSYSFVQYSQVGYDYGFCAILPYMNEWFVLPLFLCVWLPIIYYGGIQSVPEYFERRFDRRTRILVLVLLLTYLVIYIGINLLTIGIAMNGIFQFQPLLLASIGFDIDNPALTFGGFLSWDIIVPAAVIAYVASLYLHKGGQTSVIMTDLIQGFLLLGVGLGLFFVGIAEVGGFGQLWQNLPADHRFPFAKFNSPPALNAAGDFWNDAMIGTFAFYFINQGVIMRFLSARSVRDGRKAAFVVVAVLMPLAAIAVSGAGWIGKALVTQGAMTPPAESKDIFVTVAKFISAPGVYGLVIAAMIAALMSTLDTLITAVCAMAVNDIGRLVRPNRPDSYYLTLARRVAVVVTLVGIALVPVFDQFESIYQALSYFTSLIMPPLVVVLLFAVLVPRFDARSAFVTLVAGTLAMIVSIVVPAVVAPFAHGIGPDEGYTYIRAFFGFVVCTGIALIMLLMQKARPKVQDGLYAGTIRAAERKYKGADVSYEGVGKKVAISGERYSSEVPGGQILLPEDVKNKLSARPGDFIHVSDARPWLGGFRSVRLTLGDGMSEVVAMAESAKDDGHFLDGLPLVVEKIM